MLSIIRPWARLLSEKHRMIISQKYWFKFSSFTPLTKLVFEEPHNCAAQWTSHKALRLIGVVQEPDLQGNGSCSQLQRLLHCFCFPVPHVQTGAIFPWSKIYIIVTTPKTRKGFYQYKSGIELTGRLLDISHIVLKKGPRLEVWGDRFTLICMELSNWEVHWSGAELVLKLLLLLLSSLLCPFLVDSCRMFGLVYSPWKRVTTNHHGSQVSLFLLLTGTVVSLVFLLSPTVLFSG